MEKIKVNILSVGEVKQVDTMYDIIDASLSGDAVLMVEGLNQALVISAKGWDKRPVSEPDTETVVRGPREGFTENLRTSTALLRRKIKNPTLRMEASEVGKRTRTKICIAYMDELANPELIKEVKRRLGNINSDTILADGYIEECIEDAPFSVCQRDYDIKPVRVLEQP